MNPKEKMVADEMLHQIQKRLDSGIPVHEEVRNYESFLHCIHLRLAINAPARRGWLIRLLGLY